MFLIVLKRTILLFVCGALLSLAGCYQAHSDDDLRTVPATNNPHLIHDSNKHSMIGGPTH
jgi:hypothetical protein